MSVIIKVVYQILCNIKGGFEVKLSYRRTFLVGLAFLSISAFWQLYDNIIPLILKNTFGFRESVTGGIMAIDNVLAIFLLPMFGTLSDKTHTKLGKRLPYIILGTIVASTMMILLPIADQKENLLLFLIVLGIVLVAMGSYRSPAVALMPDVTPKPLRSKANAVINLMGAVGAIYALAMIKLLIKKQERPDYFLVYLSVAILMVVAVLVLVLTVRENKLSKQIQEQEAHAAATAEVVDDREKDVDMPKDVKKSFCYLLASIFLWFMAYNAVTTAFSRYAVKVWKLEGGSFSNCLMVGMAAGIISFIPLGILSSKIGRKKAILLGIVLMTCSYLAGFFFFEYSPLIYLVFVFTGIGWSSINVNSYPMIVEMSKSSNIGKYTGIYYTFSMAAQILTPILSGLLLDVEYHTLFPYAVVFSFASLCTMLRVKHGDVIADKKTSLLEHFDLED